MAGAFQTSYYPSTHQSVAYTGTSGRITNPVSQYNNVVRIVCTTAAYVRIGTPDGQGNLTATTSDVYCPADVPEYFSIKPGQKVAAVRVSASGTLHVTEMTQ